MKAIIFDFDGVIHDTFDMCYDINKKVNGEMTADIYRDMFNGNIYASNQIKSGGSRLYFELSGPKYAKLRLNSDIRKTLLKLKTQYLLFIISSNSEKVLSSYLKNNDASHIFTQILGVETHKSKIEKFKMIFKKYDLNKDNCVFVTDTLGDILEANKLEIDTIAVDFGFHERERLEKGNPRKIISHFEDISPAIAEISQSRY